MSKRTFRQPLQPQTAQQPSYPPLAAFEPSRRQFLARLGAAVLGAGALGALVGCGDRPFNDQPDATVLAGVPQQPDAGLDGHLEPDSGEVTMGVDTPPDAGLDSRLSADVGQLEGGVARVPDAALDQRRDNEPLAGVPYQPDAGLDALLLPGSAPQPEAAGDHE